MNDNEVLFVRSSKKNGNKSTEGDSSTNKNGNKSTEGDSSTNEDDIWDDTLLVKAYDEAVKLAQQSYLKKKHDSEVNSKVKKKGEHKWKVGDKCRCQYSEDLKYYEADIIEILGSSGMCVVKYVGYENEEKVPLKKLKPSEGDSARSRQCKEAFEENEQDSSMKVENYQDNNNSLPPVQQKFFGTKKERNFKKGHGITEPDSFRFLNSSPPQIGNPIIPPPPPPHMFNKLNEDENETEAMSAMLISWYMSGYHTGYYQGLKMAKKQ